MNKTAIIFTVIFILVIIGSMGYLYWFYERPLQQEANDFVNISIFAKDETGKLIRTGYRIYYEGSNFVERETNENSPVLATAPRNKTLIIYNFNLENQTYYTDYKENITTNTDVSIFRVNLILREPTELDFNKSGIFGIDREINITASAKGRFQDAVICIDRSDKILYTDILNMERKEIPNTLQKCYDSMKDFDIGDKLDFTINNAYFGVIDSKEYVNLSFYDTIYGFNLNETYRYQQSYIVKN